MAYPDKNLQVLYVLPSGTPVAASFIVVGSTVIIHSHNPFIGNGNCWDIRQPRSIFKQLPHIMHSYEHSSIIHQTGQFPNDHAGLRERKQDYT